MLSVNVLLLSSGFFFHPFLLLPSFYQALLRLSLSLSHFLSQVTWPIIDELADWQLGSFMQKVGKEKNEVMMNLHSNLIELSLSLSLLSHFTCLCHTHNKV